MLLTLYCVCRYLEFSSAFSLPLSLSYLSVCLSLLSLTHIVSLSVYISIFSLSPLLISFSVPVSHVMILLM